MSTNITSDFHYKNNRTTVITITDQITFTVPQSTGHGQEYTVSRSIYTLLYQSLPLQTQAALNQDLIQ
jgi:hypothetical protein